MKTSKKLGNPAAIATTATALAPTVGKIVEKREERAAAREQFILRNAVPVLVTTAAIIGIIYGPKWYANWKANNYAKNNIGKPEVTAAAIIYGSFKRFEPKGFLSWFIPSINIYTDKNALNAIAIRVSNLANVSKAYSILFQRNLLFDIQQGLSTQEMQSFFDVISGKDGNPTPDRIFLIDAELFSAQKSVMAVKMAKKTDGRWHSTNELYGNFNYNDSLGTVVFYGVYEPTGAKYYIVKKTKWCPIGCDYGLVWHNYVTDQKI